MKYIEKVLSDSIRVHLWITARVFLPSGNRCYADHLTDEALDLESFDTLVALAERILVSDAEILKILTLISDHARNLERRPTSNFFETGEDGKTLAGLSLENFNDLNVITGRHLRYSKLRSKRVALGVFLVKLRHNISFKVLALWFRLGSAGNASRTFQTVCDILYENEHLWMP